MNIFERFLGPNTKLRASLLVVAVALAVVNFPVLTDWLDPKLKEQVMAAAWTVTQGAILAVLAFAKQANVTGNGAVDAPAKKPDAQGFNRPALWLALLLPLGLMGCATDTGDARRDRAGRVTNAVLKEAGDYAFRVAINSLTQSISAQANGESIDLAHSVAEGLWTQAPSIVSGGGVRRIVEAWGDDRLPGLGEDLARQYATLNPRTPAERAAVINQLADGVSAAALLAAP